METLEDLVRSYEMEFRLIKWMSSDWSAKEAGRSQEVVQSAGRPLEILSNISADRPCIERTVLRNAISLEDEEWREAGPLSSGRTLGTK